MSAEPITGNEYIMATIMMMVFVWAVFWVGCSSINQDECVKRGAEYDHTSLLFTGYCKVNGLVVRLKGLGDD